MNRTFRVFQIVFILGVLILSSGFIKGKMGPEQPLQNDPWIAPKEADGVKNPFTGNEKATLKGKNIYDTQCWQCHGLTGKGDGPGAALLDPKPANYSNRIVQEQSDGALVWKISTGRGAMPSFKDILSLGERWYLVNYIRRLGGN